MDHEALQQLRSDYRVDAMLRDRMDDVFSHGCLAIFWSAVDDAIEKGCGLLEAAEVVEPNPMDLSASRCASNLFHCNREAVLPYAASVQEQIAGMVGPSEASPSSERPVAETKRKGWLARLLGR